MCHASQCFSVPSGRPAVDVSNHNERGRRGVTLHNDSQQPTAPDIGTAPSAAPHHDSDAARNMMAAGAAFCAGRRKPPPTQSLFHAQSSMRSVAPKVISVQGRSLLNGLPSGRLPLHQGRAVAGPNESPPQACTQARAPEVGSPLRIGPADPDVPTLHRYSAHPRQPRSDAAKPGHSISDNLLPVDSSDPRIVTRDLA